MPHSVILAPAIPAGRLALRRTLLIGLIAFLTLVDLFAAQAILPSLAAHYGVSPAAMGSAVNASTFGMAAGALGIALFGSRVPRREGILISLLALAVPTALLGLAPDPASFALLRVAQGLCMAAGFTLTLAHLGERCAMGQSASAFAAYVAGNVASNLLGRLGAAVLVEHAGLAANFVGFAVLNLMGAALVWSTIDRVPPTGASTGAAWRQHLRHSVLVVCLGIGFCILFAFVGTFTYVTFVLVRAPFGLSPMQLGLLCLVFAPALATTPLANLLIRRMGARGGLVQSVSLAVAGLPLLLLPRVDAVVLGLVLVAAGTFLAQAITAGLVVQAAGNDRAAASGLYLTAYFAGGLAGSVVLGLVFEVLGWAGCVAGIALALVVAGALGRHLPADGSVGSG